ncbi:hypothetical protein ABFS82_13G156300 [Erythranthe guttata]|uniref:E3 ubiquitin-protein ligase At1g63170 isoform X1 n=1 Tax=Erythranthe guttata TaxID=4155 RepID=UPI00064E0716|nr:PREDICTED: E3 ubiquitin-protein ligase At1g63170 isoform X1 [Erythranthe guttata]|eukprot:XP_012848583.1 PREDICTED: E3 ubiquitin-protein ligase At1g63170 isoform X1 [Erythranthe guttata]
MNTRYFFTPDSLCTSVSITSILPAEERAAPSNSNPFSHPRPSSRNNSPSFLIKLAMRVSRSRWYVYLRRVFHYQNGSGSDLGPNPFDSRNWMLMELVSLSVQIIATSYTLIVSGGERPVWPMRIWVSGYAFGCFLSLVLLSWRYRLVYLIGTDIEQQRNHEESRNMQCMYKFKTWLELIFAIWFVMGNVWVFDARFDSFRHAPKLHILCISLLAWNSVSYSFPFILFVLLCCCVPLLSSILGYNMNTGSHQKGATEEQLAGLSSWRYKVLELGTSAKNHEFPECCICLAKYREKEEIRELPCNHIFHLNCVDQWLKILSCCPLCKQGIEK